MSPIKNTKKKQTPYFDFFLQTSDTNKVRGICYEPQQIKKLLEPFQKNVMLSPECPSKHVCALTIKLVDGKLQAYTCFNNALQSFLASIEKSTSLDNITKNQLEDLFLNAGTVQMVVDNSMDVVDQFLPKAIKNNFANTNSFTAILEMKDLFKDINLIYQRR